MATTCKLIAKNVLNTTATSIVFDNIPQTFTDLVLVFSARTTATGYTDDLVRVRFNGDSGATNYTRRLLIGDGATASSVSSTAGAIGVGLAQTSSATANTFSNCEIYITNYAGSANKSVTATSVTENNATTALIYAGAGLWSNTAAITSLTLLSTTFASDSSFFLYGITRVDDNTPGRFGIKATGGQEVYESGGYRVHIFKNSGTFTVLEPGFIEYLAIGGGGGGGAANGSAGGGGAGGYRSSVGGELSGGNSSTEGQILMKPGTYSVLVGAGGSDSASGSNTIFHTITSVGGGAGGAGNGLPKSGGSGGGAASISLGVVSGGSATSLQGNVGGSSSNGTSSGTYSGGGGGGAGAVGANATLTVCGNGGAGISSSITGTSVTRAGGGGGGGGSSVTAGSGGVGGGGNGKSNTATTGDSGQTNTGSGGGAGGWQPGIIGAGGSGGSGIVIIRYPI